jgi:hypothetical protein
MQVFKQPGRGTHIHVLHGGRRVVGHAQVGDDQHALRVGVRGCAPPAGMSGAAACMDCWPCSLIVGQSDSMRAHGCTWHNQRRATLGERGDDKRREASARHLCTVGGNC